MGKEERLRRCVLGLHVSAPECYVRLVCCSGGHNFASRTFGKKGKGKGKRKGKRSNEYEATDDPYGGYSQWGKRQRQDSESSLAKEMRELRTALAEK